jgi:hypothetical protein
MSAFPNIPHFALIYFGETTFEALSKRTGLGHFPTEDFKETVGNNRRILIRTGSRRKYSVIYCNFKYNHFYVDFLLWESIKSYLHYAKYDEAMAQQLFGTWNNIKNKQVLPDITVAFWINCYKFVYGDDYIEKLLLTIKHVQDDQT